jgi:tripartite-type tricarboxylate transporter receptor subunit TctC
MLPILRSLLLACGILAAALPAAAAWPDKPIRLVVPFSPGGTVDVVARAVATQLGKQLGTPVVVENVPGAGGSIATQKVASAAADGYTLLFTTPNHTINPALMPKLAFDADKDFAPVSVVGEIPELLVANAGQPFSDMAGFVRYARTHPGELTYASAGNGTLPHVTMELLLQRLGLRVTHVPYKGAAPALNDLLGGQVAVKLDTIATSSQHIKSGRLKPLAIAGLLRSKLMPDVPTIAESGAPGYQGILWMGILAPAGTPPERVSALHQAVVTFSRLPAYQQQLAADGVDIVAGDPASFRQQSRAELKQWASVVKASGIRIDRAAA